MITKLELIEYLKHTPENTNYNVLYSSLYNGSNKEIVDEFIEVLSRGKLTLAALQPYLAKLYEDDKTISPEPLPPFSSGGSSNAVQYVPQQLTEAQQIQARKNQGLYYESHEIGEIWSATMDIASPYDTEGGMISVIIPIEIGTEYTVIRDNIEYTLTCGSYFNIYPILGDNLDSPTGNPPFIFLIQPDVGISLVLDAETGTHTYSIHGPFTKLSAIPEKFVKPSIDKAVSHMRQADGQTYEWNGDITGKDVVWINDGSSIKEGYIKITEHLPDFQQFSHGKYVWWNNPDREPQVIKTSVWEIGTEDDQNSAWYAWSEYAMVGVPNTASVPTCTLPSRGLWAYFRINVSTGSIEKGLKILILPETLPNTKFGALCGLGKNSVEEGYGTLAEGENSHAEGGLTVASGEDSHAENRGTLASGSMAHAEGQYTIASGNSSHAEGYETKASSFASHVSGIRTEANQMAQNVCGIYNQPATLPAEFESGLTYNKGDFVTYEGEIYKSLVDNNRSQPSLRESWARSASVLFMVGNGASDDARHNAFMVDGNGGLIVPSSDNPSKYFKITVNSAGVISAEEINI